MPQPETGPADVDKIKALLNIEDDDETDDAELEDIALAVDEIVRALPVAQMPGEDDDVWPARVTRGADMLGARLFRRKNSPSGVEAFSADGAIYVSRNDPDIAMLLQLGHYAKPQVG